MHLAEAKAKPTINKAIRTNNNTKHNQDSTGALNILKTFSKFLHASFTTLTHNPLYRASSCICRCPTVVLQLVSLNGKAV